MTRHDLESTYKHNQRACEIYYAGCKKLDLDQNFAIPDGGFKSDMTWSVLRMLATS